jgi:tRNA (adenine22-N1)-methyltransferase
MGFFGSDNLDKFYLRKSDGLAEISPGEVDTCVIAGMGGGLIYQILAQYPEVTGSIGKFILQPRTKATELRQGLGMLGLKIVAEDLAKERRKISEIIVCEQDVDSGTAPGMTEVIEAQLDMLFLKKNPLLPEYLQMKIAQKEKEFRGNKKESTRLVLDLYKEWILRLRAE